MQAAARIDKQQEEPTKEVLDALTRLAVHETKHDDLDVTLKRLSDVGDALGVILQQLHHATRPAHPSQCTKNYIHDANFAPNTDVEEN